jgi:hypothetical protein
MRAADNAVYFSRAEMVCFAAFYATALPRDGLLLQKKAPANRGFCRL